MPVIASIDPTYLTMLCDVIGTDNLLNDPELKLLLKACDIDDVSPAISRRRRLFNALFAQQEKDRDADTVSDFLQKTMYHIKHTRGQKAFENCCHELNSVLAYIGYYMNEEGHLAKSDPNQVASLSSQVQERIQVLRKAFNDRNMHADVLGILRPDLLTDSNYFRAVQEAAHVLLVKVKQKAGLASEGPEIAEQAFAMGWHGYPVLAFNGLRTEAEVAEQYGLLCLMKGLFCLFQDEHTRVYRPAWTITEQEAIDILSLISFLNNKVEASVRTPR